MQTFNHLEHGWIFLQHKVSGVATIVQDHVRLPVVGRHTTIDAPPEILFRFATPGENGKSFEPDKEE
jgi:hypothetical protein